MERGSSTSVLCLLLILSGSTVVRSQFGWFSRRHTTFVVPPSYLNAVDIATPISFRVATNLKPHLPEARVPHTDVFQWSKYHSGRITNPVVWRRILYGPGKDPYTGYFIY